MFMSSIGRDKVNPKYLQSKIHAHLGRVGCRVKNRNLTITNGLGRCGLSLSQQVEDFAL